MPASCPLDSRVEPRQSPTSSQHWCQTTTRSCHVLNAELESRVKELLSWTGHPQTADKFDIRCVSFSNCRHGVFQGEDSKLHWAEETESGHKSQTRVYGCQELCPPREFSRGKQNTCHVLPLFHLSGMSRHKTFSMRFSSFTQKVISCTALPAEANSSKVSVNVYADSQGPGIPSHAMILFSWTQEITNRDLNTL